MTSTRYKDLYKSLIAGPVRIIFPLFGYILVYPVIINNFGAKVFGLWTLIAALPIVLNNFDVGISQSIKRDFSKAKSRSDIGRIKRDLIISQYAYLVIFSLLALFCIPAYFLVNTSDIYSRDRVFLSIALVTISLGLQLIGRLYGALLSGGGYNYSVQYTSLSIPVVTLLATYCGVLVRQPIEGYALGSVFASVIQIAILRHCVSRKLENWNITKIAKNTKSGFFQFCALVKKGWYLYSASLGIAVREPILRYSIATLFGLEIVGVYDVAMRVSKTGRETIASGFTVLFPLYSYFYARNQQSEIETLSRISLQILMSGGSVGLSILLFFQSTIYEIWLGSFSDWLIPLSTILIIWNSITLLNIPFWFLLQASGHEKYSARAIWFHTISSIFLMLLSAFLGINVIEVLFIWLLMAVVTQVLIFYYVHSKLGCFFQIIGSRIVILGIVLFFTLLTIGTIHCHFPGGGIEVPKKYLFLVFCIGIVLQLMVGINGIMKLLSQSTMLQKVVGLKDCISIK